MQVLSAQSRLQPAIFSFAIATMAVRCVGSRFQLGLALTVRLALWKVGSRARYRLRVHKGFFSPRPTDILRMKN